MIADFLTNLTVLEALGTAFGVTQVLLARNNNVNNYLFGIVSILLGIYVLYHSKLYADILLSLYYFVMSIYGWVYWKFGKHKEEAPISGSTTQDHLKALGIVLGCFLLMAYWLRYHTNSDVPFWDAIVVAFAWAGMWLMAKRKLENWIYLNISNIISIPLLFYKGLYIYAGLTIFLFMVGTSGYLKWRSIVRNERQEKYNPAKGAVLK
ncbi:nicotinamide riboside transporter PnuC [Arenibacter latericius]|uniref:nicotinamide riboside transporter PnuC n=1 Tax=Arenibacter latericius TaxID=86104 RepID=UPI0003FEC061|nr:nicotinamide riboside transporter PnuC [Arenibacter latericius]